MEPTVLTNELGSLEFVNPTIVDRAELGASGIAYNHTLIQSTCSLLVCRQITGGLTTQMDGIRDMQPLLNQSYDKTIASQLPLVSVLRRQIYQTKQLVIS